MSNHHSDIDVDDVLSSVRRLVADESDEERRKRQEQAADRLVLTPSLRVADPEEGEADADDGATIDAELDEATKLPEASEDEVADPAVVEEDALVEAFEEEQLSQIDGAEQVDADPVDEPSDEAETLTAELQSLENETLADEEVALHGPTETSLRAISLEDRIAELEAAVNAQRDEFDADLWTVPADRMKAKREHRVPLSKPALAALEAVPVESDAWVFPGLKEDTHIANTAMLMLLRRMGLNGLTVHGFRSTFRDWAAETTNTPSDVGEMALAHTIPSKVEAAYRRGDLLEKRRKLMQQWARYCTPATTANVTEIRVQN